MSYAIHVDVRDGKPELGDVYGEPPDGVYAINGHYDEYNETISITKQKITQASSPA